MVSLNVDWSKSQYSVELIVLTYNALSKLKMLSVLQCDSLSVVLILDISTFWTLHVICTVAYSFISTVVIFFRHNINIQIVQLHHQINNLKTKEKKGSMSLHVGPRCGPLPQVKLVAVQLFLFTYSGKNRSCSVKPTNFQLLPLGTRQGMGSSARDQKGDAAGQHVQTLLFLLSS
jgi:hypothetical protein